MNGRTCQLCGKPLSRIWAGSGGDFCSREHRNQYRLRCGMDTLLEANKHASLMRRRDQPRQFSAALLRCTSDITPHAFGPVAATLPRPLMPRLNISRVLANPKIDGGESRFLRARASNGMRGPFAAKPRLLGKIRRLSTRELAPLPLRSRPMPVALEPAPLTPLRLRHKVPPGPRRSFVMLSQHPRATLIPPRAFRGLDLEPLGKITGRRARSVKFAAKVGNAFRVSAKKEFRQRTLSLAKLAMAAPALQGMKWPQVMPLPGAAYIGQAILPYPGEQSFPIAALRQPAAPKKRDKAAVCSAPTIALRPSKPRTNQVETRPFSWRGPTLEAPQSIRNSGLRAGQPSVGPNCVALKLVPAGAGGSHRLAAAPFEPQDRAMINMSYSWNASR